MGSFLWSDVYRRNENAEIQDLVKEETELLKLKKPRMICNQYFYMENLDEMTVPVKLPFFCEELDGRNRDFDNRNSILITMGAGVAERTQILALIENLVDYKIPICLDSALFDLFGKNLDKRHVRLFEFTSEAFSQLRLVLGRPGIGLLTDCVQFGIPIIATCFDENPEIIHNGNVISKMKIGLFAANVDDAQKLSLEAYSESRLWKPFHQNILSMEMNGHTRAAEYLLED
ncbi:hypothetical protein [Leptospira tipperaryensis]|nr:hypothetical protein [Leptospira tipperaryensis]